MDIAAAGTAIASQAPVDRLDQKVSQQASEGGRDLAADQARMEQALQGPQDASAIAPAEQGPSVQPTSEGNVNSPTEAAIVDRPSGNLGDAILDGLKQAREGYSHKVDAINKQVENVGDHQPSISEMIKLQFDVMQLSMQQEMTAKIADKASSGVQTLFRSQG